MYRIEDYYDSMQIFVYDLEFIGDVKNPTTCKIWDISVHHIQSNSTFSAIIDPIPGCNYFNPPPIPELFHLTRIFLDQNNANDFTHVFFKLIRWIENRCFKNTVPILMSHNNFSSDKLVLEHECKIRNIKIPLNWLFFDTLIYFRDNTKSQTGDYSLKGLTLSILGQTLEHAHRAYTDTIALTNVIKCYTQEDYTMLKGFIYNTGSTSLRTISGIGYNVEYKFINVGFHTKEQLIKFIQFLIHQSTLIHYQTDKYVYSWLNEICTNIPTETIVFLVNQLILLIQ